LINATTKKVFELCILREGRKKNSFFIAVKFFLLLENLNSKKILSLDDLISQE